MASLPSSTKHELLTLMRRLKRGKFHISANIEGLTHSELNVILAIYIANAHGVDPIQPRHVAEWLQLTPSALSQTLKMLEDKGLIVRNRHEEDSRSISLELTEKGAQCANKGALERDAIMDEFIAYMGEEEVQHLIASLYKIIEFMETRHPETNSNKGCSCE